MHSNRVATCRCRQTSARPPPSAPRLPIPDSTWLGFVAAPPTAICDSGDRFDKSPSEIDPLFCPGPSGSRPPQWTQPLGASDATNPSRQTIPPTDRPPPNWSEIPAPSLARKAAGPTGPETPSSPWSPAACLDSREYAPPLPHASRTSPAEAHTETTSQSPTPPQTPTTPVLPAPWPCPQGICSPTPPCVAPSTRRGAYRNHVTIPHTGTNSH